jgi:hypothetical protein
MNIAEKHSAGHRTSTHIHAHPNYPNYQKIKWTMLPSPPFSLSLSLMHKHKHALILPMKADF